MDALIRQGEPSAAEIISGTSALLLMGDHAGNAVPAHMNGLGLPPGVIDMHVGWDIGAAAVARRLAVKLEATAVLARYSRLLIDPNRPIGDPASIPAVSDGLPIPANEKLNERDARARADTFFWPYHQAIDHELGRLKRLGHVPVILSVHSFTPALMKAGSARPWHVGFMYSRDERLARPLIDTLRARPGMVVGDNEPYSGVTLGYCLKLHGLAQGLPHVQVEIRQDLLATADRQAWWADLLADVLPPILAEASLKTIVHY